MKPCLSAYTLKIIAIVAMVVDHVGYMFFPQHLWIRAIGRLTMPIMAFFIAEGYFHTRNVWKYMLRLAVFAVISMLPYYMMTRTYINVMFTLLFGLASLYVLDGLKDRLHIGLRVLIVAVIGWLSMFIKADWAPFGMMMVLAFGLARGDKRKIAVYFTLVMVCYFGKYAYDALSAGNMAIFTRRAYALGVFATIPLIFLYNGKRGRDMRYLFYAFYPAHMMALAGIKYLISYFK